MRYSFGRLAVFPLVMLGVSFLVFDAIRVVPGDALTAYFSLDQNRAVQFIGGLGGLFRGDPGIAVSLVQSIGGTILERFALTLQVPLMSMTIALAIGLPAGILAATRSGRPSDLIVRIGPMIGQSMPQVAVVFLSIDVVSAGSGVLPDKGPLRAPCRGPTCQSRAGDPAGCRAWQRFHGGRQTGVACGNPADQRRPSRAPGRVRHRRVWPRRGGDAFAGVTLWR